MSGELHYIFQPEEKKKTQSESFIDMKKVCEAETLHKVLVLNTVDVRERVDLG